MAKDGRATVSELARAAGRSPASVTRRLDHLRSRHCGSPLTSSRSTSDTRCRYVSGCAWPSGTSAPSEPPWPPTRKSPLPPSPPARPT
nr:winged helix-turn-helix transcriptional regulator [Streptomyces sp. NRRL F-5755]